MRVTFSARHSMNPSQEADSGSGRPCDPPVQSLVTHSSDTQREENKERFCSGNIVFLGVIAPLKQIYKKKRELFKIATVSRMLRPSSVHCFCFLCLAGWPVDEKKRQSVTLKVKVRFLK